MTARASGVAVDQALAVRLASKATDVLSLAAGTVRPAHALKVRTSRVFVVENWVRQIDGRDTLPSADESQIGSLRPTSSI